MSSPTEQHSESGHNRMVHAIHPSGMEVVRYDRAGKWYVELPGTSFRQHMTVIQAALYAVKSEATIHFDRPGGGAFDRKVRSVLSCGPVVEAAT